MLSVIVLSVVAPFGAKVIAQTIILKTYQMKGMKMRLQRGMAMP